MKEPSQNLSGTLVSPPVQILAMKGVMRSAKNFTKGYSDAQIKVREATSNEPWGPTMGQLEAISNLTHHPSMFADIVHIIDKRLNDHGKNWRHVFKTLVLLEYCICCGSESVVSYARESLYVIKTLKEFQHVDEFGIDQGGNIRLKSRDIVDLLQDEGRLAEARRTKSVPPGRPISVGPLTFDDDGSSNSRRASSTVGIVDQTSNRPNSRRKSFQDLQACEEEDAMNLALAESKRIYEEEQRKKNEAEGILPKFLETVGRSKSSSSGTPPLLLDQGEMVEEVKLNLNDGEGEKKQKATLTVDMLLEMDNDAFSQALDDDSLGLQKSRSDQLSSLNIGSVYNNSSFPNASGMYQQPNFDKGSQGPVCFQQVHYSSYPLPQMPMPIQAPIGIPLPSHHSFYPQQFSAFNYHGNGINHHNNGLTQDPYAPVQSRAFSLDSSSGLKNFGTKSPSSTTSAEQNEPNSAFADPFSDLRPPERVLSTRLGKVASLNGSYSNLEASCGIMDNPFEANESKPNDYNQVKNSNANGAIAIEFVPMPLAPGQAPVNYASNIGDANIGAKPVQHVNLTPHFSNINNN